MGSIEPVQDALNVLIIGAGPVGLALGLDLGRRGIRSTIIERKPGTATEIEAKASVLNERTMEYCRLLGVRDEVANAGYPQDLPGDTVYCTSINGRLIGRLEMPSYQERDLPEESSEMLQRCPQCWFDPVLARAIERQGMATLRYGLELVDCKQDQSGVTCVVKLVEGGEEEEIRAQYVAACDGPSSKARKALGIPFNGKDLGHTLSAVVEIEDLWRYCAFGEPKAERYMFIGPDGTWGNFTTVDGGNLWRFSVVGMEGKIGDIKSYDISPLVRKALGRDDIPFTIRRVLQWRRSQYTADQYNAGRIFLCGDAAHTMSPTGGHGLNTGLGDASDLSWILQALLEGWGGQHLLHAYQTERRHIAIRNGQGSTKNFGIWKEDKGRDKVLEDGPEADEQRKAIGERMAATMRQEFQSIGLALGYDYASSPLVVPDGTPAPPNEPELYIPTSRPGHRAPHIWLEEGRATIDLFGKGFVLLSFGPEAPDAQGIIKAARRVGLPLDCVSIEHEKAAALYQRKLVLVRPDGMVAWRGDTLPENVESLLDRVRGAETIAI
ncbi:FAD binding domain-containing [Lecanosticta acicola]|uniref:FAD binding domain-containing n=1 Tax=Lecanosticta acicola TaxID=111012 RepID=A0AAI8Z986_9PEZI|nr:FAD binding domain-containing [Lecanosticta acicola]